MAFEAYGFKDDDPKCKKALLRPISTLTSSWVEFTTPGFHENFL